MNEKLSRNKIEHFYQQIIECYESEIKELYWGDKDGFIGLVEQADKSGSGEDNVTIICKNGEEIELSQLLFDFLFKGEDCCKFNYSVGRRYKYEDYIFVELIESPMVSIKSKIEENGIFPRTRGENGDIGGCFFIKSDKQSKNYDYPKQVIPFLVSQMKDRLKTSGDKLPSSFIDHFEPIKYILKIKEHDDNLLIKLLYKLGTNLGIVENRTLENQEIIVQHEIQSIFDTENASNLTNDREENLDSLKFYISAIRNPNPYYRFLDAYHILESFIHKYFYNYVKNLDNNVDKAKLYDDIKQHIREDKMVLKLIIEDCLDVSDFTKIKTELVNIKAQEAANRIGKSYGIENCTVNDTGDFATTLSQLIYAFRNAIVHSKESDRHIERIEESPNLLSGFIGLTNILLIIVKCVLERNIDRW